MRLQSTKGQATKSVILALVGKTTDFLSCYLLVLPIQYVVMAYFSSSVAYVNGLQVIWYWGQQGKLQEGPQQQLDSSTEPHDSGSDSSDHEKESGKNENTEESEEGSKSARTLCVRIAAFCLLCTVLVGYLIGLVWNMWNPLAVLPPLIIIVVVLTAYCYLHRCDYCMNRYPSNREDNSNSETTKEKGPLPDPVTSVRL